MRRRFLLFPELYDDEHRLLRFAHDLCLYGLRKSAKREPLTVEPFENGLRLKKPEVQQNVEANLEVEDSAAATVGQIGNGTTCTLSGAV
jgi:hypothetical protein